MSTTPAPDIAATAPEQGQTPLQPTEPPAQVSGGHPTETISAEGPTGRAKHLKAWREAGGVTGPRLDPIQRAAANPTSLSLAIRAKCYDCVGQDADANWQRRVGTCSCTTCPLHHVRPYRRGVTQDGGDQ